MGRSHSPLALSTAEEPGRVDHHGHVGQRLRGSGGHRRQPSDGGQEHSRRIVAGCEPEVLFDDTERAAANGDRLGHSAPVVLHERNMGRLDGRAPALLLVHCYFLPGFPGRQCVDLGVDVRVIAEALGHESLESTKIYTQVSFQRTRKIAELFCSPGG